MLNITSNIMVFGRIWWGEPTPNFSLKMKTWYEVESVPMILQLEPVRLTFPLVYFARCLLHGN
jgi:hypothetical protein